MNESMGSFKLLEDVHLKATENMEIGGRHFSTGETIAFFDKISVSGLSEARSYIAARGGYNNRARVFWDNTRELRLNFTQGVFSTTQFSLLTNAKVIKIAEEEPVLVTIVENLESKEDGTLETKFEPISSIFVYDKETSNKIEWQKENSTLKIDEGYKDVIVTYQYNYIGGARVAEIGRRAFNGFLELEGKTRVKDDTSGQITTGIIKIPQLKLMSGLSIKLGTQANPVVGNFEAVGVPVDLGNNSYVAEFYFLNNDIDSDM